MEKLMSTRRHVLACALLAPVAAMRAVAAPPTLVPGRDYTVLQRAQGPEKTGTLEVIEFFSWACPHCYEFYPLLTPWVAKLPKGVVFRKVPLGFGRPEWANLERAYYALESTGDLARLDAPMFEAIHKQHLQLRDQLSITNWLGTQGVNTQQFAIAYNSFGVSTRVSQAEGMVEPYQVDYVPTLAVGGRYTVTGAHEKMLAVASELIAKVRADVVAQK
jgi:thiol:disulfide interchange protein DsbA